MQEITGYMKVADVIRRWPDTAQVLRTRGYRGSGVGLMARMMTVQNFARMEGIELALFARRLEQSGNARGARCAASELIGTTK